MRSSHGGGRSNLRQLPRRRRGRDRSRLLTMAGDGCHEPCLPSGAAGDGLATAAETRARASASTTKTSRRASRLFPLRRYSPARAARIRLRVSLTPSRLQARIHRPRPLAYRGLKLISQIRKQPPPPPPPVGRRKPPHLGPRVTMRSAVPLSSSLSVGGGLGCAAALSAERSNDGEEPSSTCHRGSCTAVQKAATCHSGTQPRKKQ